MLEEKKRGYTISRQIITLSLWEGERRATDMRKSLLLCLLGLFVAVPALADDFDFSGNFAYDNDCLLYTSPSPRDRTRARMPSSA